jgi:DNA-binding IclR family transcriptional regulator
MLLAHQDEEDLCAIFDDLKGRPEIALSGADAMRLRERAREARQDGFALAFGETKPAHQVIAVPLFSRHGQFVGSLGSSRACGAPPPESTLMAEVQLLQAAADRFALNYEGTARLPERGPKDGYTTPSTAVDCRQRADLAVS